MINSRDIKDLHPLVQPMAKAFLSKCNSRLENLGVEVRLTSTLRDSAAQAAEYAKGRTTRGPACSCKVRAPDGSCAKHPLGLTVTRANAGQSFHNYRVAFDFCPFIHGVPQWANTSLFRACGEIAEEVGLEWSGRWTNNPEMAHCQFTDGLSIKDFQAGKKLEDVK